MGHEDGHDSDLDHNTRFFGVEVGVRVCTGFSGWVRIV